jgi:hypothetical protein
MNKLSFMANIPKLGAKDFLIDNNSSSEQSIRSLGSENQEKLVISD